MSFESKEQAEGYWKENLKIMLKLLAVWFVVSYGCGILFIDQLNEITFMGFKLGFWFAQHVLRSCGNIALLVGITVSLINLMSIGYNWSNTADSGYLGVAVATVIMSTFIGLVVKVLCVVGFYRIQGE